MKIYLITLFITTLLFSGNNGIQNYTALFPIECEEVNGTEEAIIRVFDENRTKHYLAVNTTTLKTDIIQDIDELKECNESSRYISLIDKSSSAPYPLQNDGITNMSSGIYITTDLCPSSKRGFEKRLYEAVIKHFKNPAPITLFITKRWIERHSKEFELLKRWDRDGNLSIIWGNHTAYHHYSPKVALKHNFVLYSKEHLKNDILTLERYLIDRGVTPSIFFRFPGLVSDRRSVEIAKRLGLIIIGSDAWLAKGQMPKDGSIILIHGNKNEPKGVDIFLKLLKEEQIKDIRSLRVETLTPPTPPASQEAQDIYR